MTLEIINSAHMPSEMLCGVSNQPADGAVSLAQGTKEAFISLNNIWVLMIQSSLKMNSFSSQNWGSEASQANFQIVEKWIQVFSWWTAISQGSCSAVSMVIYKIKESVVLAPFSHMTRIYHQWAGKTYLVLAPGFKSTNREQFQLPETGFRVMRERTTDISLLFLSKFSQAWKSLSTAGASIESYFTLSSWIVADLNHEQLPESQLTWLVYELQ